MSNKPIVPIFSGKSSKLGMLIYNMPSLKILDDGRICLCGIEARIGQTIKPETLRISIDNGTTWATMEEVREALEYTKMYKCEYCDKEFMKHQMYHLCDSGEGWYADQHECPECRGVMINNLTGWSV